MTSKLLSFAVLCAVLAFTATDAELETMVERMQAAVRAVATRTTERSLT